MTEAQWYISNIYERKKGRMNDADQKWMTGDAITGKRGGKEGNVKLPPPSRRLELVYHVLKFVHPHGQGFFGISLEVEHLRRGTAGSSQQGINVISVLVVWIARVDGDLKAVRVAEAFLWYRLQCSVPQINLAFVEQGRRCAIFAWSRKDELVAE